MDLVQIQLTSIRVTNVTSWQFDTYVSSSHSCQPGQQKPMAVLLAMSSLLFVACQTQPGTSYAADCIVRLTELWHRAGGECAVGPPDLDQKQSAASALDNQMPLLAMRAVPDNPDGNGIRQHAHLAVIPEQLSNSRDDVGIVIASLEGVHALVAPLRPGRHGHSLRPQQPACGALLQVVHTLA